MDLMTDIEFNSLEPGDILKFNSLIDKDSLFLIYEKFKSDDKLIAYTLLGINGERIGDTLMAIVPSYWTLVSKHGEIDEDISTMVARD